MGSVKDLKVAKKPTDILAGEGVFTFSDRYSVFDWGEMPDHIDGKGKALCVIGAYFFEKLHDAGIDSHYRGIVDGENGVRRLKEAGEAPAAMAVNLYRVIRPAEKGGNYDYSVYRGLSGNHLVPLEIIYRNRLPEGSSVFRRITDGSLDLADIGLSVPPRPGDIPERPILDVSTKLETTDRYVSWNEAKSISGLSEDAFRRMKEMTEEINAIITREVEAIGLVNEDGKVEFALDEKGRVVVVDVLGTPDECRFTYNGVHLSKELARLFYRDSEWHRSVEEAKKTDRLTWKCLVKIPPPPLPGRLGEQLSQMYMSVANEITGRNWFSVPSLRDVMNEISIEGYSH